MQLSEKLGSATALAAQLAAAGSNTRWRNPPGPDVGGKSNNFSVVISTGKYKKQDFMNIAILILSGILIPILKRILVLNIVFLHSFAVANGKPPGIP